MLSLKIILLTTIIIELITIIGRFGLKISMKELWTNRMKKKNTKHFFHFHHLFFGAIVVFIASLLNNQLFINLGIGIALSDIIHHLFILWPIVGNPEFHIIYRNAKHISKDKQIAHREKGAFYRHIIHHIK